MKTGIKKWTTIPIALTSLGASLGIGVGAQLLSEHPAGAATNISGTVMCVDGDNVEGVWIQANNGGSNFAGWGYNGVNYVAYFNFSLPKGGAWTVHVGCGGSRQHWHYTPDGNRTTTSENANWTCYTPDTGQSRDFCQLT